MNPFLENLGTRRFDGFVGPPLLPRLLNEALPSRQIGSIFTDFFKHEINGPVRSTLLVEQGVWKELAKQHRKEWNLVQRILEEGAAYFKGLDSDVCHRLGIRIVGSADSKRTVILQLSSPFYFKEHAYNAIKLKGVLIPAANEPIKPIDVGLAGQPFTNMLVKNGKVTQEVIYGRGEGVMESEQAYRQIFYDRLFQILGDEEDLTFGIGNYSKKFLGENAEGEIQEFSVSYLLTLLVDPNDKRAGEIGVSPKDIIIYPSALRRYHQVGRHGYSNDGNAKFNCYGQIYFMDREDTLAWQEIDPQSRVLYAAYDFMRIAFIYSRSCADTRISWEEYLKSYFVKAPESQIQSFAKQMSYNGDNAALNLASFFLSPDNHSFNPELQQLFESELEQELALPCF